VTHDSRSQAGSTGTYRESFVHAGMRRPQNLRRLDEKIGMLVDAQIRSEDRAAELDEKIRVLIDAQIKNEERFAK